MAKKTSKKTGTGKPLGRPPKNQDKGPQTGTVTTASENPPAETEPADQVIETTDPTSDDNHGEGESSGNDGGETLTSGPEYPDSLMRQLIVNHRGIPLEEQSESIDHIFHSLDSLLGTLPRDSGVKPEESADELAGLSTASMSIPNTKVADALDFMEKECRQTAWPIDAGSTALKECSNRVWHRAGRMICDRIRKALDLE